MHLWGCCTAVRLVEEKTKVTQSQTEDVGRFKKSKVLFIRVIRIAELLVAWIYNQQRGLLYPAAIAALFGRVTAYGVDAGPTKSSQRLAVHAA